jgi:hypothetical protein
MISNFIFQLNTCGYSLYVTSSLNKDESVVYNCCWPSSAQSFSGPSPAKLMVILYCSDSRLPKPGGPSPRIYIPQEEDGPVIPPGTGFPFRRILRLAGLRWRYSTPPQYGASFSISHDTLYTKFYIISCFLCYCIPVISTCINAPAYFTVIPQPRTLAYKARLII